MKIILASGSPRRKELLSRVVPHFDIVCADVDESLPAGTPPEEGVEILAVRKGEAVAKAHPDALILSSDTLVEVDGAPLGKPKDAEDAVRMLKLLSGRAHFVRTGIAVHAGGTVRSGVATTAVFFRPLSDEEITAYVATGEPLDKAGAYGIQGKGGALVDHIDGDFDTVMGLSLSLAVALMEEITGTSMERLIGDAD